MGNSSHLSLLVVLVLILATSRAIPSKYGSIPHEDYETMEDEKRNLATFIQWAIPVPDSISPATPTPDLVSESADNTTTPSSTPILETHPDLVNQSSSSTTTTLSSVNLTTTTPTTTESSILTAATPSSNSNKNVTRATPTESSIIVEPLIPSSSSSSDSNMEKEVIYVIRRGPSGSVVGIIREALGLVANTIRVVGINLSLFGGPLLLGTEPGSGPLTRINSTHFKFVRPPIRFATRMPSTKNVTGLL